MHILITGVTGLIGTALANHLAKDGHAVTGLTRDPQKTNHLAPAVRLVKWDGRTSHGWLEYLEGADAVVNLAGESIAGETLLALVSKRWTPDRKKTILESRLNASKAVLRAVDQASMKPGALIQASAVGYYGSHPDSPLTEQTGPGNDLLADICARWEDSSKGVEAMGVRRAIIRTAGVVMSSQGGALPFMLLPFKLFAGGPIGTGKQWFSWIHITDEVRAIRFLIENPTASGVFNLSAPQQITNLEFSKVAGRVLHRPSFIPTPAIFFRLLFGEKASVLLGSQRQVPQRLSEAGFSFTFPTIEGALRDLVEIRA